MADEYIDKDIELEDEIEFIEVDSEVILNRLIEKFEYYLGETLYPGDERRIFLQGIAYVLADEANHINETGRGNLIKYATGNEIDAIAQLFSNTRLPAEHSKVEIQFTLSSGVSTEVVVPAGTRVTPDGIYLFATNENIVFEAGTKELTRIVEATAVSAGADYNGFVAGQINRIVDANPYIKSVVNTTESAGGTDIETDEEFKERLQISPFSFAVAGPSESYRSIAMGVSNTIGDVHVYSPEAGVVEIAVIFDSGDVPDEDDEILGEIHKACSDRNVRPLTDFVRVVPAEVVSIDVDVSYFVANNDVTVIPAIVEAIEEYKEWQTAKIGRSINPDYLRKLLMEAGAAKVDVVSPAYRELEENQVAQIENTTFNYKGSITM